MSVQPPIPTEVIVQTIRSLQKEVSETEDHLRRLREELEWYERGQQLFGNSVEPAVERLPGIEEEREPGNDMATREGGKPMLRDAILHVLAQEPRKTWKTEVVIEELRTRGWLPGGKNAEHHTRSKLAEMHRKGQARRVDRGRYRLPPEPKDAP